GADGFSHALDVLHQPGRYFDLETPVWRIAGLDTSLAAERLTRNDGLLDDGQLAWLDNLLQKQDGKRLILMSHHFTVSAWGSPSPSLVHQMRDRTAKVDAWYWGHEHGCATYEKTVVGFAGACVGNGAFRERWTP